MHAKKLRELLDQAIRRIEDLVDGEHCSYMWLRQEGETCKQAKTRQQGVECIDCPECEARSFLKRVRLVYSETETET